MQEQSAKEGAQAQGMAIKNINSEAKTQDQTSKSRSGISLRAIIIGIILVAVVCFIVSWSEIVLQSIQIGFLQMPPAAIGIFFFLVILNSQMQRMSRRFGLRPGEMLMIYMMMVVAAMVSSRGLMEKFISVLVTPNYYANSGNTWQKLYFPNIPKWLVPFDPNGPAQQKLVKGFFEGLRDGERIPWEYWTGPLLIWLILVLLVLFAFLCLATILRKQWVDNEKLSFPLVQPPLELVHEQGQSLLSNKALWGGILIPTVVFAMNGLHAWYPAIPEIQLSLLLNPFFQNPPLSYMYYTCIFFSFAAIGFFFLLPSELLFSVWFFALFARLQGVIAGAHGVELSRMRVYGTHAFVAYQTAGAYLVLAAYMFYVAIPHLKRVFKSTFSREKADDANEMMPYRIALPGLIISFLLILLWCRYIAQMSPWVALLEFGVFIGVIALIMTRSTAEAGMLMTETTFRPVDLYRLFAPVANLGPGNITMLAFFDALFLREQRGLIFTGMMDGLKITDGANVKRRSFLLVFVIAILIAILVAGTIQMWLPYKFGGINLYSTVYNGHNVANFTDYEAQVLNPQKADWQSAAGFIVGIFTTIFLAYMRTMFFWWPLHPLGYALSVSWTVSVFWFSALTAWLLKVIILRYGGMKLYTKARPWFIGMILGEFGTAVIWAIIGALTNHPTPTYPWP